MWFDLMTLQWLRPTQSCRAWTRFAFERSAGQNPPSTIWRGNQNQIYFGWLWDRIGKSRNTENEERILIFSQMVLIPSFLMGGSAVRGEEKMISQLVWTFKKLNGDKKKRRVQDLDLKGLHGPGALPHGQEGGAIRWGERAPLFFWNHLIFLAACAHYMGLLNLKFVSYI